MRRRTVGVLAAGGAAVLLTGAGWGAFAMTSEEPAGARAPAPAAADRRAEGEDKAVIKLPDGRRVEVRYVEGKGLGERHYSPGTKKWSKTQLIYETGSDACQGIELAATDGTVAAIADFGRFCYDGEPPQESVAAVGTGSFSKWDTDLQEGFDGWNKANVAEGGGSASFVHYTEEIVETLRWSEKDGFSGPTEKPRPPRKLSGKFFGSWMAQDGSQRVAVQKRGNGGVATFFSQEGERCVTRVGLHPNRTRVGEFSAVHRAEGERSQSCPAWGEFEFMKLNKAGTALSFQTSDLTFTRTEPNEEEQDLPEKPGPVFTVDKDWLGDWELEDGSQRVTVEESRPRDVVATFTDQGGTHCVARAELYTMHVDQLHNIASAPPEVVEGKPAANCPAKAVDFVLSSDGESFVQKVEDGRDLTYVRPSASKE